MADHMPILKNYQKKYYPRIIFTPKLREELPETGASFLTCQLINDLGVVSPLRIVVNRCFEIRRVYYGYQL